MSFAVGVHGYPLPSVSRVQHHHLARVRDAGADTVGLYMTARERAEPERWSRRLATRLEVAGMRCSHLVGVASMLLAHDEVDRRSAVESTAAGLEAVVAAGAERLFVQPGGFSPQGPWWWHPLNFRGASRDALARSLGELGRRAEASGVGVVVEGYQCSVLESPAVMREVIEAAGSPAVGANLDYVNFLTPPDLARFETAFDRMIHDLGPRVVSAHVKDAIVWPRLSAHVDEVQAGDGILDLQLVVDWAKAAQVPVLVEHLRPPRADEAISHLASLARGEGRPS